MRGAPVLLLLLLLLLLLVAAAAVAAAPLRRSGAAADEHTALYARAESGGGARVAAAARGLPPLWRGDDSAALCGGAAAAPAEALLVEVKFAAERQLTAACEALLGPRRCFSAAPGLFQVFAARSDVCRLLDDAGAGVLSLRLTPPALRVDGALRSALRARARASAAQGDADAAAQLLRRNAQGRIELTVLLLGNTVRALYDAPEVAARFASELGARASCAAVADTLLRVECAPDAAWAVLEWLAVQPEVQLVHEAEHFSIRNAFTHSISQAGSPVSSDTPIWDRGLLGQGQLVQVGDTGVDQDVCFFQNGKIAQYLAFGDTGDSHGHGTHVAGTVAGFVSGNPYNGMAPSALLSICDISTSPSGSLSSLPADVRPQFLGLPYAAGARIFSESWGAPTNAYTVTSAQFDDFLINHPDAIALIAAGNSGSTPLEPFHTVGSPATAKNVIAVGAGVSSPSYWSSVLTFGVSMAQAVNGVGSVVGVNLVNGGSPSAVSAPVVAMLPLGNCVSMTNVGSASGRIAVVVLSPAGSCSASNVAGAVATLVNAGAVGVVVENAVDAVLGAPVTVTSSVPVALVTPFGGATLRQFAADHPGLSATLGAGQGASSNLANDASYSADNVAYFSSWGPTSDDRIAPQLFAPGYFIGSAAASVLSGSNCAVRSLAGTSMATPVVSGSMALLRQYFTEGWYPSGAANASNALVPRGSLMKAMMIASTQPGGVVNRLTANSLAAGAYAQGYGRIQLDRVLRFADSNFSLSAVNALAVSGAEVVTLCFDVVNTSMPFTVVVVWTDPLQTVSGFGALVNNIDLVVRGPLNHTYFGNAAQRPGAQTFDQLNPTEVVRVPAGAPTGHYAVQLVGARVVSASQIVSVVATGHFVELEGGACALFCPGNCSAHGQCVSGACLCDAGFSGPACNVSSAPLAYNSSRSVSLPAGTWTFFAVDLRGAPAGSQLVTLAVLPSAGDPDVFVRFGGTPTFALNDVFDVRAPGLSVYSIPFTPGNGLLRNDTAFVGIYAYCCSDAVFEVRVLRGVACPVACSPTGGACDYLTGTCACLPGFSGTTCSNSVSQASARGVLVASAAALGAALALVALAF